MKKFKKHNVFVKANVASLEELTGFLKNRKLGVEVSNLEGFEKTELYKVLGSKIKEKVIGIELEGLFPKLIVDVLKF